MPRTGKGQKVATATGQTYGQATAQEEAQKAIPLPQVEQPSPTPARPGATPFSRPTERPSEPVGTRATTPVPSRETDLARRKRTASLLPMLEALASDQYASPHLRNTVRKMKRFVGDPGELIDRGE